MANIPIRDIPGAVQTAPSPNALLPMDNGTAMEKTTVQAIVDSGAPVASKTEAEAGSDNAKRMTALRVKESIAAEVGQTIASSAQGDKADSAVQPSRTISAGTGLVGGGDLSADRSFALSTTALASLALADTSVQPARSITAGTGLVGGGDLSADRTISLSTAAQVSLALADTAVQPTITISAGTGLTGGGDLSASRAIALSSASIASLAKADSSVQTVNGNAPDGAGNVVVDAEFTQEQDSRASAILATFAPTVKWVRTAGYEEAGDGGGAFYKRALSEPPHAGKFQSADGAWWELVTPEANPLQFGADRAAANQNAAIQAAFAYAKAKGIGIFIPAGLWTITATLPVYTYMSLRGEGGARKTIIRLADGVNDHMLKGELTSTYWSSNPWADGEFEGDNFWDISDITFDGNRDNQTQGAGLQVWGRRWSLRNVVFQNIKDQGMVTKFNDGTTPLGMEARLDNIIIDRCGKDGWYFAGPHDSTINGLVVIDAGLDAHDTYAALRVVEGGNGRFFGFHAWSRGWNSSRMRSAVLQEAGGGSCSFDNSHFEGAQTANVDLSGAPCQFGATCMFYAAWGGINIILGSNGHTVHGVLGEQGPGRPDCVGIKLGWSSSNKSGGNSIHVRAREQRAGAIDFTHSDGANMIIVVGHNSSGVAQIGTPASTDIVNMVITGGGGGRTYANPTW